MTDRYADGFEDVNSNIKRLRKIEVDDELANIGTNAAALEQIQDAVGAMVSNNTETGITVTYQDSDGTLDFVVSDEYIADTVGAMFSGNTETGIDVTYQDADNTIDVVLNPAVTAFTPVLSGISTAGEGTYTTQLAYYQQIGKKIDFTIELVWTGHTGVGQFKITGFPVASKTGIRQVIAGQPVSVATATSPVFLEFDSATDEAKLYYINGSTRSTVDVDAAGSFYFSGFYFID